MDNNSTQQTEILMRYLDDEMSGTEKEELEKKLASDESLRAELEGLRTAKEAVEMYGLQQRVASVRKEMMEEKPQAIVRKISNTRRIGRYSLAVAASIVLIAVSVIAYNFFSLSTDKLYNEKYSSFELSAVRGNNEVQTTGIEKAYEQKNYQEVIALSVKDSIRDRKNEFLVGVSYMELNKPSEAISFFNEVIKADQTSIHPVYKDEAEYYLALSYLKAGSYDKALELMNRIHNNPSHLYHGKFTKGFIRRVKMLKWR